MAKRGVFGLKETPLDSVRGTSPAVHKPPEHEKHVTIKKAHGGFVVHTHPGKHGAFHDEHVATSMDNAIGIMSNHLGGSSADTGAGTSVQ